VRFADSDDTSISLIMVQGTGTASNLDPTLQMMKTCAYLANIPVDAQLRICKHEDFAGQLCQKAAAEFADVVLIPCRKQVGPVQFEVQCQHGLPPCGL
jgi:hypothetical protein